MLRTSNSEKGFSAIELFCVLAVIGVLSSTAFPIYNDYKRRSNDRIAQQTLRNVSNALEVYFLDNNSYISCDEKDCGAVLSGLNAINKGVLLKVDALSSSYTATASHYNGTGQSFQRRNLPHI